MDEVFRLYVYYEGMPKDFDETVKVEVGRESVGSGYMFSDGVRDLEFHFERQLEADAASARVGRLKIPGIRAEVK